MILGLCDRFNCLPHEAEALDARVLRMLKVHEEGTRREEMDSGE